MPQPTVSDVHVDAILTNISTAYIQNTASFIATKVFPVVPVEKQSNLYYKLTKNDWFRDEAQRRVAGTESAGGGYTLSTDNYRCDKYAFHKDVDDDMRRNADAPLNPDRSATKFVTQRLLLRQEIQWQTDYFTTGKWGTDVTPSNLWSDFAASNPIDDVAAGQEKILTQTGFEPNTLVLGYQVLRQLKQHPDIIDRIKYTTSENVTPALLARMFEVDNVLVCKSVKATNLEGETAAMSLVHGKHALLCYVNSAPALEEPTAGYTFAWRGVSEGLGETVGIKRFRMEEIESDRIEGQAAWTNKVVGSDLGYFFNGAVA